MHSEEIWKTIPGYEGLYEVSSYGNVKSVKINKNNILKKNKLRKLELHTTGYYKVKLSRIGKKENYYLHRLVFFVFNDLDLKTQLHVNHLDYNKLNNRLSNLELVTSRENKTYSVVKSRCSSKYTGVYLKKIKKKDGISFLWVAHIGIDRKDIHLGYFNTEKEAHQRYLEALKEHGIINKYAEG